MKSPTKTKVPELRFSEFEGEWKISNLGKSSNMKSGDFVPAKKIRDKKLDYNYPCYGGNGLRGFTDTFTHEGKYSLIGRQGALCGNVKLVEGKFHATEHAVVVKHDNNFDTDFLFYILKNLNLNRYATGQAQPGLSISNIKSVKFSFPQLPEQQKIADFLSQVDRKIDLLQQKVSALETYKKGVMQQLFSQEIRFKRGLSEAKGQVPQLRFKRALSGAEGQDDGSDFPDWEEKNLGEVFFDKKGKGISKNKVTNNGDHKCVLYGELYTKYNEVIDKVESKTDSDEGVKSKKYDLLIPSSTTTSGIDLANVTSLLKENVRLGGDIIILRSKLPINSIFYAYYLSNYKNKEIASRAQGITIVHLYFSGIKDLIIHLPCLEEQTKIANFLSSIDQKITHTQAQLEQTQSFKKGLLQKMFV